MPSTLTGRKCYTDGVINIYIKDNIIPEGFRPGRTLTQKGKDSYKNRKTNPNPKPSPISVKRKHDYEKMLKVIDEYTENYLNLGKDWCHDYYNISYGLIKTLNKQFNIHQLAVEKGNNKRHTTWETKRKSSDEELKSKIPYEEFYQYYEEENHSIEECLSKWNISQAVFIKLLHLYDFHKSAGKHNDLVLKNKIKNGYFDKSHFEDEIVNQLNCKYELNNRLLLDGKEIDIYLPEYQIGIEFNGTYWHSDINKNKSYHFDKSVKAAEKGIRLIHIYEYEWEDDLIRDKIISLLNISTRNLKSKIYARDCTIKEISNQEAKPFNDKHHLQNHRNAQITYGLFYKNELVQLMSFSKTKYNRNLKNENSWEIIRGCPASNNIVVGGVSKLFKHFIKENDPDEIFSYCDFNKFNGIGYETLGMKFIGYTDPDLKYVLDTGEVVNRNPHKYKYNKEHCKYKIYGAGSKKYLWKKV